MTKYTPGMPCWVDLGSPDVAKSTAFYTGLFGWTAEASGPEYGGYTNFFKGGKMVGAVGPLQGPGQPPVWTTYFSTDDVDALAVRVEEAGGKVMSPPMEIPPFGRMAILLDPSGAAFGGWQSHGMYGAEVMGEPGSAGWFELLTTDVATAGSFYPPALGLQRRDVDFGGSTYTLLEANGQSVAGIYTLEGMHLPPEVPPHWMIYFGVDDADAAVATAVELGGSVTAGPIDSAPGRFAVLTDPHGSAFAVIKSNPDFRV